MELGEYLGSVYCNINYLYILSKLENVCFYPHEDQKKITFTFKGGEGVLMGMIPPGMSENWKKL